MAKEKDMYPFVYDAIRSRYPASDGWIIIPQDNRGTYIPDFTVEKKVKNITHRVPVEVKLAFIATVEHISQLNKYARNLSGPNVKIDNKILVYPAGTDTSIVPKEEIEVIYLKKFKEEDK